MHHQSESINEKLAEVEATYRETGEVPEPGDGDTASTADRTTRGDPQTGGTDAPF